MSKTAKVIIVVGALGSVGLALCCGGLWWFGMRAQQLVRDVMPNITNNPAEIRKITDSMASIDIPEPWQPVMGMESKIAFAMVVYSPDQSPEARVLMLMQVTASGANQQQMQQQLRMQSSQQGMSQDITITSSETRTFTIDGQERDFLFAVGTNRNGDAVHQVTGVFPGKNGTVMLMMVEKDDDWDEAAVVEMIESISTQTTGETAESIDTAPETIETSSETTEE
jgi:hypothetical protein